MKKILIYGDSVTLKNIEIEKIISSIEGEIYTVSPENREPLTLLKNILEYKDFFSEKKNLIIRRFSSFKKKEIKEILKLISEKSYYIDTLIVESENISDLKNINFDEKIERNLPKPWEEEKWKDLVKNIAEFVGAKIEDEVVEYFLLKIGKNDLILYEEIKKLAIYSQKKIDMSAVEEMSVSFSPPEMENFCYFLSSKNKEKSLEFFNKIINHASFQPILFISYLFGYFMDLLKVLSFAEKKKRFSWPNVVDISKKSGVSKLRVKKFLGIKFKNEKQQFANHTLMYTPEDVIKIIFDIEIMDRKVKSGAEPKTLILELVSKILHTV